jgi:hypothetical protein
MNWLQDTWARLSPSWQEDPDERLAARPAHLRALVVGLILAGAIVLAIALVVALA